MFNIQVKAQASLLFTLRNVGSPGGSPAPVRECSVNSRQRPAGDGYLQASGLLVHLQLSIGENDRFMILSFDIELFVLIRVICGKLVFFNYADEVGRLESVACFFGITCLSSPLASSSHNQKPSFQTVLRSFCQSLFETHTRPCRQFRKFCIGLLPAILLLFLTSLY
jgi:hypothetical protein